MRILFITYTFGEIGVARSNHVDTRVRDLRRQGISVDVLTASEPTKSAPIVPGDESSGSVFHAGWKTVSLPSTEVSIFQRVFLPLQNQIRRQYSALKRSIRKRWFHRKDIVRWDWTEHVLRYLPFWGHDYDLIYSSGGPAVAHIVGHSIAREFEIPWIAEIQDPLIFPELVSDYNASEFDVQMLRRVEESFHDAACVITVTRASAEDVRDRIGQKNAYCVYPGASSNLFPEDLAVSEKTAERPGDRLKMIHAGVLSVQRNLEPIVNAVHALEAQSKLKIEIAGKVDPHLNMKLIEENSDFLFFSGSFPHSEIIRKIIQSDIALVLQQTGTISALTIPSKLYEYAVLGAPVLFISNSNQEILENSKKLNIYHADMKSPEMVIDTLREILDTPKEELKVPVPVLSSKAAQSVRMICDAVLTGDVLGKLGESIVLNSDFQNESGEMT